MRIRNDVALVVDDDDLVLEVLAHQLEALGINQVLTAESGDRALALLAEHDEVSLLLTDLSMPGLDGPMFLRRLADARCGARIILVSAAKPDLIESIGELGRTHGLDIVGCLTKPVQPARLRALLDAPSRRRAAGRAGPALSSHLGEDELRAALANGEIVPWYQPKVDVQALRVSGVEALARWIRPDGAMVSPGEFVPAIEHLGLSMQLFHCILDQVLVDLGRWRTAGVSVKASVNLSMDCTHRLELADEIGARLRSAGVAPEQLVIEVTESQLMTDRPASMETLTRLSLMGLSLSIDDFGTGYSNLAQLADLPFSELKLDGAFVRRAGEDAKADAILQTTSTFGQGLGLDVVAEGVERFAQLERLRRNSRWQVQGFLIARPMPAGRCLEWFAQWRPGFVDRPGCGRPPEVLVVDDSRFMRRIIENRLRAQMPEAVFQHAPDGDSALEATRDRPIDAAIVDYHMPGMDGLELIRRMRDLRPAARFCLLTVEASQQVARDAADLGALFCAKPLNEMQADRIARLLRRA